MPDAITAPVPPPGPVAPAAAEQKPPRKWRHGPPKTVATLREDGTYRYYNNRIPAVGGSSNHVANWTHRHTLVLWMHIAGQKAPAIAANLGYHVRRVTAIIGSPLFKSLMSEELEKLKGASFADLIEMIRKSTPETFEALLQLRDHAKDEKTKLGAARSLMQEADRVWPKHTEHKEEKVIRLTFDQESLRCMAVAMAEVKGVDPKAINASYKEVPASQKEEKPYEAMQANEFLKEIEEAAAVELDGDE